MDAWRWQEKEGRLTQPWGWMREGETLCWQLLPGWLPIFNSDTNQQCVDRHGRTSTSSSCSQAKLSRRRYPSATPAEAPDLSLPPPRVGRLDSRSGLHTISTGIHSFRSSAVRPCRQATLTGHAGIPTSERVDLSLSVPRHLVYSWYDEDSCLPSRACWCRWWWSCTA